MRTSCVFWPHVGSDLQPQACEHFGLGTGSVSVLGWEREYRVVSHWNRTFDE